MHKGTGPVRKRKPHNQSPTEASKKRRIARNPSEAQSGQGLRDGIVPSKNTLSDKLLYIGFSTAGLCCALLLISLYFLCSAGLTERQQLALAMEESKKAAAALQAKDRQASRQMDSEVTLTLNRFSTVPSRGCCPQSCWTCLPLLCYRCDAQRQLVACCFGRFLDCSVFERRRMTVSAQAAQTQSRTASVKMSQL